MRAGGEPAAAAARLSRFIERPLALRTGLTAGVLLSSEVYERSLAIANLAPMRPVHKPAQPSLGIKEPQTVSTSLRPRTVESRPPIGSSSAIPISLSPRVIPLSSHSCSPLRTDIASRYIFSSFGP